MAYIPRRDQIKKHFPEEPPYRLKQIERGLYDAKNKDWNDISTLRKAMRDMLSLHTPWISCSKIALYESKNKDTYKATLETHDQLRYETVLMANAREQWTICVSSQVGCAMKCTFCATGTMGLKRSLHAEEIADQYRFWQNFLQERLGEGEGKERISNVVFMGMGEPLTNYENVKDAIHTWLTYTDLGETRITVSTVGIMGELEKILVDPSWPRVKIAISLHSADPTKRKEIVPTTVPGFHEKLANWTKRYHIKLGNRRHYLTFEYTLINNINDTIEHSRALARYMKSTAAQKINVIPYNPVPGKSFERSQRDRIERFKSTLRSLGIDVTERRTMGQDIAAACGQLVYNNPETSTV